MEQMIYKKEPDCKWLAHGSYRGVEFVVMSLGTHPTAYIGPESSFRGFDPDDLCCHGGCTYESPDIKKENGELYSNGKYWYGWDYAHLGDYYGGYDELLSSSRSKKWTTEEIIEDIIVCIDSLYRHGKLCCYE